MIVTSQLLGQTTEATGCCLVWAIAERERSVTCFALLLCFGGKVKIYCMRLEKRCFFFKKYSQVYNFLIRD
jgi:hypothetical protein